MWTMIALNKIMCRSYRPLLYVHRKKRPKKTKVDTKTNPDAGGFLVNIYVQI